MRRNLASLPATWLLALSALLACKAESTQVCLPGQTRLCVDPVLGCDGSQACSASGSEWGVCSCTVERPPLSIPSAADAITPIVSRSCEQDAQCGPGLRCVQATGNDFLGQGGPAGGYCTTSCTQDSDCQAVDKSQFGSRCLVAGNAGLCVATCYSQQPDLGEGKCAGRDDLICVTETARTGAQAGLSREAGRCQPMCRADADCPSGRFCRASDGLCTNTPDRGATVGASCDPALAASCASGECLRLTADGDTMCSAPCRFAASPSRGGCGFLSAQGAEAACVVVRAQGFLSSEGDGDLGFCFELCDTAQDCQQATFDCIPVERVAEATGRQGVCSPALPGAPDAGAADGGATPAGGGTAPPTDAGTANP